MTPINFEFPWLPLPRNRTRDRAQRRLATIYMNIIQSHRAEVQCHREQAEDDQDIIWHLVLSKYKDASPVSDRQITHMLIAMVIGGQHSASATASWVLLHLASQLDFMEDLYQEQLRRMKDPNAAFTLDDIQRLELARSATKEIFRVHPPLHSLLRVAIKSLSIDGTDWIIPRGRVLLASPAAMNKSTELYIEPERWNPKRWNPKQWMSGSLRERVKNGQAEAAASPRNMYLPFGAVKHRYIGDEFSCVQLTTILSVIVRELKLRNPEGRTVVPATNYAASYSNILFFHLTARCFG